ncbi:MAG: hypothetical protein JO354_06525 [Verrucomicrobia bacterium]|nr:hypothetical protein [Verrucomicrobiota bacterium]
MAARFLVISFQRSGLNWLRHCTEYFSGIRTPGRPQLIESGPVLFDRAHDVRRGTIRTDYAGLYDSNGAEIYQRVAVLLRDPLDCFTSHYLGRADMNFKKALGKFTAYSVNILEFDRLVQARKGVFYFEDFVNDETGTFEFLRFFGIDIANRDYDFAALIAASREWYRGTHGLFGKRERPQLKRRQRAAICEMLRQQLGDRFEQYLGRYSLDG